MNKLTSHQIIDEITNHYNLNNRSINPYAGNIYGPQCLYNGHNGKHCAFARMCIDPNELEEGKNADTMLENLGMDILKPEYRGYSNDFYRDMQNLHDVKMFWNETGLSTEGKERVKELKRIYN